MLSEQVPVALRDAKKVGEERLCPGCDEKLISDEQALLERQNVAEEEHRSLDRITRVR